MNYEIGPILTVSNPMRPESTYKIWNPRFQQKPEIVSFTQILKENYVVEYGTFIRGKIRSGELPVPCFGYRSLPKVQDVTIDKAYYDRLDSISFAMYVICDVRFYDPVTQQEQYQKYYVTGYHSFNGISDYLTNADIYTGQRFHLRNQLDDYLVPYIRSSKYDAYAYELLLKYQPEALEEPCSVDAEKLANAMGFRIEYVQLLPNDNVCAKTIFRTKEVTIYENGTAVNRTFEGGTILVTTRCTADFRMNVLHECIHIEYHRMFYELQHYYRTAIRMETPDFEDFFMSDDQQDTLRSMEIQANAIAARVTIYAENLDMVISEFCDCLGRDAYHTDLVGYEKLIERITEIFGSYRSTAKTRLLHRGFKKARGVFEWGDDKYAKAHVIPEDFPDDWTYTVPLYEMSKILGRNLMFDKLVHSRKFVYADGHLCLNHSDYVYKLGGYWWLTEYAKQNMAECCLPFRRVYGKQNLKYTFGELNKEQQVRFFERVFDNEAFNRMEEKRREMLRNSLYIEEVKKGKTRRRKMTRGEAVVFLMKQAHMTEEDVAEAAECSIDALTDLRSDKEYTPRMGTMLAFFTALELDDVYRDELLIMTGLINDINKEMYQLYRIMRDTNPDGFTVYQANQYLRDIGKTPWTSGYRPKKIKKNAI